MNPFRAIIRHILLIINILFAISYVFGMLATVVPPYRTVFFCYFGLIFPVLLIVNICFIIFWLLRRRKFWLISFLLILFSFSHANNCFTVPYKSFGKQLEGDEIKILSYNISSLGQTKNKRNFYDFIAEIDADIVCFQEFGYYEKYKNNLTEEMKKQYPYSHIWYKNQGKNHSWGVATFSKFPIVFKKKIDFESVFNVSIFSDIVIKNDTIRLFNNHLESNKFTMKDIKQYQKLSFSKNEFYNMSSIISQKLGDAYKIRALQAETVAREIERTPYGVIVCGDFNDVAESYAYRTIKGSLTDLYTSVCWGYRYTFRTKKIPVGIDHILIDKNFVPVSMKILNKTFSDHYPLIGKIYYKK
jgi:endonuclease/exonuclease/phosphatase family metal-dependent hydrolase